MSAVERKALEQARDALQGTTGGAMKALAIINAALEPVGFDLEDPDAGVKRLAFMEQQATEFDLWRDAVVAELKRFGVADINAGGEHERLHDAIVYWAETLAQLRLADPDPAHAERALAERRAKWESWS